MKIYEEDGQVCLFGPAGCVGKMFQARSAAEHRSTRTSASSWRRSFELKAVNYMFLDLSGPGNLLGSLYWEIRSPWLGGSSMLNTGPAPLNAVDVFSLSQILQDSPPRKYYLSRTACLGILRRAKERGKELPSQLKAALMAQAGLCSAPTVRSGLKAYHINQRDEGIDLHGVSGALMATSNMQMQTFVTGDPIAFAANQRDEVRDLHDVAGTLGAQPGMKQQTFIAQDCLTPWDTQQARIFTLESKAPTLTGADGGGGRNPAGLLYTAGFCAGAAPTAGGIGYQEECAPTLKAAESGTNMVPSILCLNDQGGSVMECSKDIAGTLRPQEHGHQPLVFDNHGQDTRFKGPVGAAQTVSASFGEGGNNQPLVIAVQEEILEEDAIPTVELFENHAIYSRQRVDVFKDDEIASTECARQHKDATDLIYQETVGALTSRDRKDPNSQYTGQDKQIAEGSLLIRRLTPLECERLMGCPDGWTDIPGASDSARYRSLGNSVAIPCVEYIMRGIAMAAGA